MIKREYIGLKQVRVEIRRERHPINTEQIIQENGVVRPFSITVNVLVKQGNKETYNYVEKFITTSTSELIETLVIMFKQLEQLEVSTVLTSLLYNI